MKKFFLIPLLTLLTCVMAWAGIYNQVPDPAGVLGNDPHKASIRKAVMEDDPVEATNEAKIGSVEYATLQEAFDAATNGDVVELLADVNTGFWLAAEVDDKSLTIKGNGFKIQGCLILANETNSPMEITFDGVSINSTSWVMYAIGDIDIVLNAGSSNSLVSSKNYGIFGYGNSGDVNISGQGTLTSSISYMFYQCANVQIEAPNATFSTTSSSFGMQTTNIVLEAGSYGFNPASYVDFTSYIVTKPSSLYIVSAPAADVVAYNQNKLATYASLSAAVEDASAADVIYLYKNDASAVTVAKNITIKTNGHSTNLSAGVDYSRADMGQNVVFTDNAIAAFLMADGTASLTVSEDANIASAGAIHVNGTKTLTINEGVTVTYKRQGSDGNIVVDKDAKLTVLGSGTFAPQMHSETNTVNGFTVETSTTASNQVGNRAIDVAVGGELVVGVKDDPNNCPHFITSSIARGSAVSVDGKATFNNANIQAACASIWNYGSVIINSGEYVSVATAQNGINGGWYSYNLRNDAGSNLVINDGHFVGTQGCVAVYAGATADINGGHFETVHGYNYKTGAANATDHHYALYVAREAIVNVYNGYFKVATPSAGGGKVILSGNDDAYNTYGVINIYGGYFQRKADVQAKKNGESSYPASVPTTSQWYSSFGSLAPLPAGYEYYDTGDATYPYGVQPIAGKETAEIESTETTIPWQQSTTWAEGEVPENNTIVTIPVGKTVVVSKDETKKEAVADQLFINKGASLTVQDGTTLNVETGVNIAEGGKLVVDAGAMVTIGEGGLVDGNEEAIEVKMVEGKTGIFMIAPDVKENTHPMAKVDLVSKAYKRGENDYVWQRFGLPAYMTGVKRGDMIYDHDAYPTSVLKLDYENKTWAPMADKDEFIPFRCYELTTTNPAAGGVYTFPCNLMGNGDAELELVADWNYYANSYTAPIDIAELISSVADNNSDNVSGTVYLYRASDNWWYEINLASLGEEGIPTVIDPMQAFIFQRRKLGGANPEVNYENHIWNPIMNPKASPAPARTRATYNKAIVEITAADGTKDIVRLIEGERFSDEFDNTWDAAKYMNAESFNLYADAQDEKMGILATDDLEGTTLSMTTKNQTSFTMTFSNVNCMNYAVRDMLTGTETVINENESYMFSVPANTTVEGRFEIVAADKVATSIDNIEETAAVKGIYTVTGQFVGKDYHNLPNGVYVVDGKKIVK